MKILYTGSCGTGSLTESRRRALVELGHEVVTIDQREFFGRGPALLRKAQNHLLVGPGVIAYNRALVRQARSFSPDLIYIDQATCLWPRTVRRLKATGARVVHYTSEVFSHLAHVYRLLMKVVDLYDIHVVTFPTARDYLMKRGAKKVLYTEFGYDPELHLPTSGGRGALSHDMVFIGHWEPAYEKWVAALRDAGVPITVFGPGWRRSGLTDRGSIRPVHGKGYVETLGSSKVCLGLLSEWGGNIWAVSRTFEIPAVGRFLLAIRTPMQQGYFEEGREAEYFSTPEELVQKARYYLDHDNAREGIAAAGHARCLSSPYTHKDRMQKLLEEIMA